MTAVAEAAALAALAIPEALAASAAGTGIGGTIMIPRTTNSNALIEPLPPKTKDNSAPTSGIKITTCRLSPINSAETLPAPKLDSQAGGFRKRVRKPVKRHDILEASHVSTEGMGEPSRPRVKVSGQISLASTPSSSSIAPRVRAKVDHATISTTPTSTRPPIRSVPSSTSLRPAGSTSSATDVRSSAPHVRAIHTPATIPPRSPPLTNERSTRAVRVRAGLLYRAKSPETPLYRSMTEALNHSGLGPKSSARTPLPSRADGSAEVHIRTRAHPTTPTPNSRLPPPSHCLWDVTASQDSTLGASPTRAIAAASPDGPTPDPAIVSPSNRIATFPSSIHLQHPIASCPPSPLPTRGSHDDPRRTRPLPPHPTQTQLVTLLPSTPASPEVKTIRLPEVTPRTSSEFEHIHVSNLGQQEIDRDRLSGVTVVEIDLGKEEDRSVEDNDASGRVEEAKVNRKIADLEISNASLLAINSSLEVTKSKQRAEILRLRRALRDSLTGIPQPALMSPALMSPALDTENLFDEEFADAELEARWDRVSELVGGMVRRGEVAVEKGKEEVKLGTRVLAVDDITRESTPGPVGPEDGEEDVSVPSATVQHEA